jgi:hypothetical protein
MVRLFDIDNRRIHQFDGKAFAIVPAADAQRAYGKAVYVLAAAKERSTI